MRRAAVRYSCLDRTGGNDLSGSGITATAGAPVSAVPQSDRSRIYTCTTDQVSAVRSEFSDGWSVYLYCMIVRPLEISPNLPST